MALRMTGLNSGLDTESIVGALMEAHKAKKTKVDNKKTTLEWKQEIWKDLNKKIYSFYTNFAGKLRFQTNYMTKKVSSSNSSKVTGTANVNAVNGTYTVKVNKMAAAQNVTSAKLGTYKTTDKDGNEVDQKVTGKTKLADLGMTADGTSQIQIETSKKTVVMTVNENTTINDFISSLKDAGLTASFDETQGRFFIGSSASGADQSFKITTNTLDSSASAALNAVRSAVDYDNLSASDKKTVNAALDEMYNTFLKKGGFDQDAVDKATDKIEKMLDANVKKAATNKYTEELNDKYIADYVSSSDEDGNITGLTANGIQALKDAKKYVDPDDEVAKALAKDPTLTQDQQDEIKEKANQKNYKAAKKLIEDTVVKDIKSDDYKAKIDQDVADAKTARNANPATNTSALLNAYGAAMDGGVINNTGSSAELQNLGLDTITGEAVKEEEGKGAGADGKGMVVIKAEDSEVVVNGATLTSKNTVLEVNGLTLNLTGTTDEEVTITITDDTQGVYDMIKEFVNQYNSILTEMNTYFNAASSRGYDPLTSEQKSEMSDDEVEKWEKKIKDSLLRRDSTLDGLLTTFRSITASTIKASNGKNYSLAVLGITTGRDYKENGLLHIKGDEDDTDYADDENTLMKLLNSDPQVVTEVLAGITTQLYNTLTKKMQSSTLSSALTFYNDKEMNKQLSQYNKDISKWETKLKEMEDRYYKQFAAMEKALANMQSQQSALSGFFGY